MVSLFILLCHLSHLNGTETPNCCCNLMLWNSVMVILNVDFTCNAAVVTVVAFTGYQKAYPPANEHVRSVCTN